ncbi:hypothetical protein VTK26DRAFT_4454 [Humicola hyalothermophila]
MSPVIQTNDSPDPQPRPGNSPKAGDTAHPKEHPQRGNAPNSGATSPQKEEGGGGRSPKLNPVNRVMEKLGLNRSILTAMFKGSLPPTIGLAMLQAPAVSGYFTTLGYLVPIISVLAMAIFPRGKFLMNLFLFTLAVCFGSAVAMLALWTAVKAREHTTPPGLEASLGPVYNSSDSAICAVWLFANIWFSNTVRAKLPAFNFPVIVYSILVNISLTFGPRFTTVLAARLYMRRLLTGMLTALGLALGVNLFVFPVSSRLGLFEEFTGGIGLLRKLVSLQKAYLASLESTSLFPTATRTGTSLGKGDGKPTQEDCELLWSKETEAAKNLEQAGAELKELMGKMHVDLPFAKRDIAWGKLDAKDLSEMFKLFRNVYIPLLGMNTILDIFRRFSQKPDWDGSDDTREKEPERHVWSEVMKQIQEPFEILSEAIDLGLEHAGMCLELLPRPKKTATRRASQSSSAIDVEAAEQPMPGDPGFASVIDDRIGAFHSREGELLQIWIKERGVDLEEEAAESAAFRSERDQVQLYIILYMENLMHATAEAVQDLVAFADGKVEDGTMRRKRLVVPSLRRLKKWFVAEFSSNVDSSANEESGMETGSNIVYFGDGHRRKRDPERLPPTSTWQRFGDKLRKVGDFLGSEESAFGFRVACATLTVGIVGYLEPTQQFFVRHRMVWAMVAICLGMTITSGQSVFGLLCRVGGTVLAMILAYINWYIVNGSVPGVIFFLWLSVFINYYFFIKYPRFVPVILITIITQVLIIGYELEVHAIGLATAESNGQPYYPIYLLAPYRVACVAGGCLVAFIWTIFPKPVADRTRLRRDLSATFYLLANYFGVVSSSLMTSVQGSAGDVNMPGTPAHHLFKVGYKIFRKISLLIPAMSQHLEWQKWEPTIGGRFPREAYDDIIQRCNRINSYLTLATYIHMHPYRAHVGGDRGGGEDADDEDENKGLSSPRRSGRSGQYSHSRSYPASPSNTNGQSNSRCPSVHASAGNREWQGALAEVLEVLKPARHTILSTLTLLSNALLSGQSLPPFLPLPRPYEVTRYLMRMRPPAAMAMTTMTALAADKAGKETNGVGVGAGAADGMDGAPIVMVDSRTGDPGDYRRGRGGDSSTVVNQDLAVANTLSPRNLGRPGYSEFAVFQICATLVSTDLESLMSAVSKLVGVVDFGFRFGDSGLSLELEKGADGKGERD